MNINNKITTQQLQNEYDYILAQSLVETMLKEGLITVDEFNKIKELNLKTFSPMLAEIMS